jgi:tape measure domain-containing protein
MTDATLSAKVTADIADFAQKFDQVRRSIDGLGSSVSGGAKNASSQLNDLNEKISTIGTLLTSGALIQGGKAITELVTMPLIGLGQSAITMADNLRRAEMAFTTLTGSADRANALLRDLQAFAATTPFEFPQLVEAGKRMLAMGFSAQQLIPTLTAIGDATAGLGGGVDVMNRIILALGQMQAKGKVASQEMKQLADASIPAWDLLAQKLGVTVPEAMKLVQRGAVDAATGVSAVLEGMAQKFGGLMAQQSATIQGTISNLHETLGFILTDIGRELIETLHLREALLAVGEFARGFLDWFRSLDEGTKQLVVVFTGVFAASGPILVAVGAFMAALSVITAPMLVGGAIIAGIIAGVTLILLNWQKIKDTGIALWQELKDRVAAIVTALANAVQTHLVDRFNAIVNAVGAKIEAVKGFFRGLYNAVVGQSYIPDMVDEIGRHMQNLDVALVAPARNATNQTGRIIEGAVFTWQTAINQFVSTLNFSWGSVAQTVGQNLARMTTSTVQWGEVAIRMGQQVLGNLITTALQVAAQWAISETMRATATTAANATITASNAATAATTASVWATAAGAMAAVFGALAIAVKTLLIGLAKAAVGVVGLVVSGIGVVLNSVSTVVGFMLTMIGQMLIKLGTSIASLPIPILAQVVGAAVIAAGGAAIALGAALPGIVAGLTAALGAGVASLASAIPALQHGGLVTRPTLAMIGEAGPEAVVPLSHGGLFGGGVTVVLEVDRQELARMVAPALVHEVRMRVGAVA